jgi:alkylation response protein AidB-like acyl-CoA dehydrogenase
MHFGLTEDQAEIKRVARELLGVRAPWPKLREAAESRAYDDRLWAELVELGWPGIAVAESHGGQGLGSVELSVLLEETGYACAATPFLSTATAAAVIQSAGSSSQRERWLPALAAGDATGAIGTRELAVDAAGAAVIVLLEGERVVLIDRAEADVKPFDTIDPTRRYATVAGEGEPLHASARDRIHGAIAAEVVGVCQRALDMTVAYVAERTQFDRPVGAFQAVAHRCARMLLDTEAARSTALYSAWAGDADPERLPEAAALAAAAAAAAGPSVTGSAIQAHGGIGFTWEADAHWLFKRAQLDSALLGGARRHRAALARHCQRLRPAARLSP